MSFSSNNFYNFFAYKLRVEIDGAAFNVEFIQSFIKKEIVGAVSQYKIVFNFKFGNLEMGFKIFVIL